MSKKIHILLIILGLFLYLFPLITTDNNDLAFLSVIGTFCILINLFILAGFGDFFKSRQLHKKLTTTGILTIGKILNCEKTNFYVRKRQPEYKLTIDLLTTNKK